MKLSNYRYNHIGGIDADRELESGEVVPYTLTDEEIEGLGDVTVSEYQENPMAAVNNFRAERQKMLDEAVVAISTGKSFDADEQSIIRLSQALIRTEGLPDDFVIPWSTADVGTGVMVDCTREEIKEAHTNAVDNMSQIWSV